MARRHVTDSFLHHLLSLRFCFCLIEGISCPSLHHPGPASCSRPCPLRPVSSGFRLSKRASGILWEEGMERRQRDACGAREGRSFARAQTAARRPPNHPCAYRSAIRRHWAVWGYTGAPVVHRCVRRVPKRAPVPSLSASACCTVPGPNARGAGTLARAAPSGRRRRGGCTGGVMCAS
ncbi:hypothetical protein C8R47DRAFT_1147048 [Mycena vitilis]|nr:hypothetical protein C8R47DRAFT_1147048 [Mycena vitilis]